MSLTKEQREKLPASEFALPAQRKLPIHDKQHVVLAWGAADSLRGDERLEAKRAILRKAHALQVQTTTWHLKNMTVPLEAKSIDFGDIQEHCNRFPFSGVLTYLDEPSDRPVGGTGGKRVVMSKAAAENALDSLLGMAVDFTPDFDGHAPTRKIGLITAADVEDNQIKIAGYFWAADFPEEVALIKRDKDKLGFSYECRSFIVDVKADPLVVAATEFTGAAVLYKDKAAYMKTSLAARADQHGDTKMDKDIQDAFSALTTSLTAMATAIGTLPKTIGDSVASVLTANADKDKQTKLDAAKVNASTLRASAGNLKSQGLGNAAIALEAEASHIEQYVAKGEVPPPYVPASGGQQQQQNSNNESGDMKTLKDAVASMATAITDLSHKVTAGGGNGNQQQQQRKTLSASSAALLSKTGLKIEGDNKITVAALDAAAQKAQLPTHESMALKMALKDAGVLAMQ